MFDSSTAYIYVFMVKAYLLELFHQNFVLYIVEHFFIINNVAVNTFLLIKTFLCKNLHREQGVFCALPKCVPPMRSSIFCSVVATDCGLANLLYPLVTLIYRKFNRSCTKMVIQIITR